MKIIAQNKKAFHDYSILNTVEAGIVLTGDEVKSLRLGHVSLVGAFATVHQGELFLINCNITPYAKAFQAKDEGTRSRKLLLHKKELNKMIGDIAKKGITIVPLKIYFNNKNLAKVELGIAKHKKAADKKSELRERDIKRETSRELRGKIRF
ncbi:SsrA-binding protein [Candidatus Dependentiae bacterium Noda2021]|nr:SsrA-binding protein [Candidatus Dependentiae bacterium Noda2021]